MRRDFQDDARVVIKMDRETYLQLRQRASREGLTLPDWLTKAAKDAVTKAEILRTSNIGPRSLGEP